MPVKHVIARGVGFSPGEIGYIVTGGFTNLATGLSFTVPQADLSLDTKPPIVDGGPAATNLRHIVARGIGFNPATISYIVTGGFAFEMPQGLVVPQADLLLEAFEPNVQIIPTGKILKTVPTAQFVLDGKAPTLTPGRKRSVPQADLVLDTKTPTMVRGVNRSVPQANLVLSGSSGTTISIALVDSHTSAPEGRVVEVAAPGRSVAVDVEDLD